jgi:drug/metabolite transporter (DMT)-like permease
VLLRPLEAALVAPPVLWLSLLNATLCTFAPVVMVMLAIERVGATMAAQVGMIGPLSTVLMGVFILDEALNVWIVAGTVLVLLGVALLARARSNAVVNIKEA